MKHLVDLDDDLLQEVMRYLGTTTIKGTVDRALRRLADERRAERERAFYRLAELVEQIPVVDRSEAW